MINSQIQLYTTADGQVTVEVTQHLVTGCTLNQRRLQERGIEFEQAVTTVTHFGQSAVDSAGDEAGDHYGQLNMATKHGNSMEWGEA